MADGLVEEGICTNVGMVLELAAELEVLTCTGWIIVLMTKRTLHDGWSDEVESLLDGCDVEVD